MKKNDVFTFTAPNGVEVAAVILQRVSSGIGRATLYCYGQNRIFTCQLYGEHCVRIEDCDSILADYAILPDYDELLARYNDLEVAQAETQSGM